ncbi:SPFH domain-containing protein [Fodinicola feengrottensis]|uniref:SPFH domain-containing protein n=1 Tax=Fodinicola feengrottensis TaxID=435914 RepID=UPI002442C40E|nr:SPFH domain-containing protein [Fodinicola feengrottensis]
MADITRLPGLRHLRGTPTLHIRHLRNGKVLHAGTGASFWFRPLSLSAVLSEVPVDDRQLPLLFHARTADFQDVSVQATVTYRIVDPGKADGRLDFSIDPDFGGWRSAPLEQIAGLLTETAQQYAVELLVRTTLADALVDGPATVRDGITLGLATNARLAEIGLDVIGVRVVAIRPESEVERALQTPARELVQQEADRATYERRAVAVERERAIAQNELDSQIELARREQELVGQRGTNARRQAEEAAAANRIETAAQAEREVALATARADAKRVLGDAEAAAEKLLTSPRTEICRRALCWRWRQKSWPGTCRKLAAWW